MKRTRVEPSALEGFPGGAVVKSLPAKAGDTRDRNDPWVGKIIWRRKWQPLQCSCLGNPMDTGVWGSSSQGSKRIGYDLATKKQQH